MFTDLNHALEVLMARRRSLHPQLLKFRKLIEDLDFPGDALQSIHIAGTNGKGSTTNFIRSICQAQGYKVGTFTSPHLVRHHDRFRVNDIDISDEKLLELINRSYPYWDEYDITMFEIDMLIATWFFLDEKVDVAIFEVGMGGRKDATNVLRAPLAQIITNISLDHMAQLGDTVEEIGTEKAGIIKETGLVLTGELRPTVLEIFKEKANRPIYELQEIVDQGIRTFKYRDSVIKLQSYAKYQYRNAALAFETCYQLNEHNLLKFDLDNIVKGLENTIWKGRFEVVSEKPLTIIDGAHNQDGIQKLIDSLSDFPRPINIVFSALKDKETDSMIHQLMTIADKLIVTTFDFYRAQSMENLRIDESIVGFEDYKEAIQYAQSITTEGTLVITGSLYFISEVRHDFSVE